MSPLAAVAYMPSAQEVESRVQRAVNRFARVYRADRFREDMHQVAWEAVLTAARTFDPARRSNFFAYAWRGIELQLDNYVRRGHACVSASSPRSLAGTGFAVSDDVLTRRSIPRELWPDALVDRKRVAERMREVVRCPVAWAVLFEEARPRELARERGIEVRDIYRAVVKARAALAASPRLCQTWNEWRK